MAACASMYTIHAMNINSAHVPTPTSHAHTHTTANEQTKLTGCRSLVVFHQYGRPHSDMIAGQTNDRLRFKPSCCFWITTAQPVLDARLDGESALSPIHILDA